MKKREAVGLGTGKLQGGAWTKDYTGLQKETKKERDLNCLKGGSKRRMDEEEGECRLGNGKIAWKKERHDMDEFLHMATEGNE